MCQSYPKAPPARKRRTSEERTRLIEIGERVVAQEAREARWRQIGVTVAALLLYSTLCYQLWLWFEEMSRA